MRHEPGTCKLVCRRSIRAMEFDTPAARYFLYRPEGKRITWAPELFVPTYQLETLLDAVNEKLGTKLCIPQGSDEWLFRMSFGGDGCPVPRYAGSFNNGEEFDNLTKKIPGRRDSDNATSVRPVVLDKHLEKFAAINRAISEPRRKRDGGIARRQKMRDSWRQVSKRARRYLGLRPRKCTCHPFSELFPADASSVAGPFYSIVSLDSPAPFMPVSPVRLISIDVEMFEFDHSVITEVGLAILDTWTVARVAPKEKGEAWFPFIKAHHFIVREHRHRVNRRFVSGCPDKFDFG